MYDDNHEQAEVATVGPVVIWGFVLVPEDRACVVEVIVDEAVDVENVCAEQLDVQKARVTKNPASLLVVFISSHI